VSLSIVIHRLMVSERTLVRDLRIDVPPGAVHTLMGPSGCGKSTLLAAVCGIAAPAVCLEGSITLDGRAIDPLPTRQRGVGILFQDDLLFPHMTVRENLLFAVPAGPKPAREAIVSRALQDLELGDLGGADPATLSGGQRARVALMRALLARPRALLLDEPFSRLDADLRQRVRAQVFETLRACAIPAVLVTHDLQDVADASRLTRWGPLGGPAFGRARDR
jgi:putative thiamine transport system ATP-binding protein